MLNKLGYDVIDISLLSDDRPLCCGRTFLATGMIEEARKEAKRLIDVAAKAGADYVKFQTFKAETLVTQTAEKAEYQQGLTGADETQLEMIKKDFLDPILNIK